MKTISIVMISMLLLAAPVQAGLGLYASRWDTKDYDDSLGAGIKISDTVSFLRLQASASYFSDFKNENEKLTVYPFEGAAFVELPLGFYGGGGLGYYMMDAESRKEDVDVSANDEWGVFAAAGWEFALPAITLFAEARYTWVQANSTIRNLEFPPDEDETKLDGTTLTIGLILAF